MSPTRHVKLGILLGIGALAVACGGRESVMPATETTSARIPATSSEAEQSRLEIARLERERNEARERVADELQRNELQAQKLASELEARRDRIDLAQVASSKVDAAEAELKALEKKAARAPLKARLKLEKSLLSVREKLAIAQSNARQVGLDHGAAWSSFKAGVEASLSDLEKEIRSARSGLRL